MFLAPILTVSRSRRFRKPRRLALIFSYVTTETDVFSFLISFADQLFDFLIKTRQSKRSKMADAAAPKKRGRPAKSTTESKEKTEVRIDRLKSFSDFNFLAIYVFLGEKGREETRSTGR